MSAMIGSFLVQWLIANIGWIILYVVQAAALQTIAKKTRTENGWFAWIPILNFVLMADIGKANPVLLAAMFVLSLVPYGWIFAALGWMYLWARIALAREKHQFYGVLMAVPFVNLIVMLYLAYYD